MTYADFPFPFAGKPLKLEEMPKLNFGTLLNLTSLEQTAGQCETRRRLMKNRFMGALSGV